MRVSISVRGISNRLYSGLSIMGRSYFHFLFLIMMLKIIKKRVKIDEPKMNTRPLVRFKATTNTRYIAATTIALPITAANNMTPKGVGVSLPDVFGSRIITSNASTPVQSTQDEIREAVVIPVTIPSTHSKMYWHTHILIVSFPVPIFNRFDPPPQ